MARLDAFLEIGKQQGGSDIHLCVGLPPLVRLDGELLPIKYRTLSIEENEALLGEVLDEQQQQRLAELGAVDLAYELPGIGRFRINVVKHFRGMSAICRVVPEKVPDLASLRLPPVVAQLCRQTSGLILVTGPTGTGKSTTLAAMIHEINKHRSLSIVTLEDPIEFVHKSDKCLIVQRELGRHFHSFHDGLLSALRQDPDVILVGELRDPDSVTLALEAAETGHLVLGTLHARGAGQTISRILDAHPSENQAQIRHSLADNLRAVVSQELIRAADGRGRRAALEILVMNTAVAQLVREGKVFQLPGQMVSGKRQGMQLMDQSLLSLVRAGEIDPDEAFLRANEKIDFMPFVTKRELIALAGGAESRGAA